MAELKISVDPVYLQVVANLQYLSAASPSSDRSAEEKRMRAIKVLTNVQAELKSLVCGPAMGIVVEFRNSKAD